MEGFVDFKKNGSEANLTIDDNIYNKNIIMKAAYVLLDKAYFLFKLDGTNILVNVISKGDNKIEEVVGDFSDELLSVYLRDLLEKDNKLIREEIVTKALTYALDEGNFNDNRCDSCVNDNQVDFDKDIDEILKEIEDDPELQIDKEEIEKILKEIEEETN